MGPVPSAPSPEPLLDRGCRRGLIVGSLALILVLTLFPYELTRGSWADAFADRFVFAVIYNPLDFVLNVLLFIPLGLGFATRRAWLPALLVGVLVSCGIEAVQVLQPSRNPTVADILANGLGVLVGVGLGPARALRFCRRAATFRRLLTPRVLAVILIVHGTGMVVLQRSAVDRASLGNWDPEYGLYCGNEATANRPWRGQVTQLRIWNRALAPREANGPGPDPLYRYDLTGADDLSEHKGGLSSFTWRGAAPEKVADAVSLGPEHWLAATGAGPAVARSILASGAFTLQVRCATADTGQSGPGRIVSLSQDPYRRNFTLGQDGHDLVFRLRTPFTGDNGSEPELIVPDVFRDTAWCTVTVVYDGGSVKVWTGEGRPVGYLGLGRAAFFCWGLLHFDEANQFGYTVVWWVLTILVPLMLLAGIGLRWGRRSASSATASTRRPPD